MHSKFANVTVETETRILCRKIINLDNVDVLHEHWCFDGITAESVIFANADITNLSQEDLEQIVKSSVLFKQGSCTVTFGADFTFVNFNFFAD